MEAEQHFRSFFNFYRHHRIDQTNKIKPFKLNPYRHKLFIAKSIVILLLCTLMAVYCKSFEHDLIPNRGCINRIINWLSFSATLSTAFVVVWEALAGCREDVDIWNMFQTIETALNVSDRNSKSIFLKTHRVYGGIFYTLVALMCSMAVVLLADFKILDSAMVDFITVFELLSAVDMHRILHILMYVRILTSYLCRVREDIEKIVKDINSGVVGSDHYREVEERLNVCCACYFLCMKSFSQIQDQFACGIFMVCLKFSIIIWNEIYWTVYRAIMETNFELYCLNVVPYHFIFISFTWACERLNTEIKDLSQLLYTIDMRKTSSSVKRRITHLMLLLNYKVFFFHTFGVRKVSYNCIVQYLISGATKVSFIAQIMKEFYSVMKESNESQDEN